MDSIRLKTKELQSKMYLTRTHWLRLVDSDSLTDWTHKSGQLEMLRYSWNLVFGQCNIQFGTQVRKCLQFEWHFNSGPWRQDVLYGPAQNFALCRLRPSQDSRAVGRQPAIPRSLEYRTILYKTTFVLDKLWRHVSDKNYELQRCM